MLAGCRSQGDREVGFAGADISLEHQVLCVV